MHKRNRLTLSFSALVCSAALALLPLVSDGGYAQAESADVPAVVNSENSAEVADTPVEVADTPAEVADTPAEVAKSLMGGYTSRR